MTICWGTVVILSLLLSASAGAETLTHRLTWQDNAENEAGFRIYRREEEQPGPGSFLDQIPMPDVTSYEDTVPDVTRRYCYTISAYNALMEGPRSNEICSQNLDDLLGAPTNLEILSVIK